VTGASSARQVWRVRRWVRLVSVAVPLLMLPFMVFPPLMPNPEWQRNGMPASEWFWAGPIYAVLIVAAWSAFHSRIELDQGRLRVVNPWGSQVVSASDVVDAGPGPFGVKFFLSSGRAVTAFAVQCTSVHPGGESRWVDVARAVTGAEPR